MCNDENYYNLKTKAVIVRTIFEFKYTELTHQ